MPKRVIDGEAIATSKKLRHVREEFRIHYPYLVTLALANGSFEYDPEAIWSTRYSLFMPDIKPPTVADMLKDFERAGLLYSWYDYATRRQWGYWVGIEKPGRLPPPMRRGKNERIGAIPPPDKLDLYLQCEVTDTDCVHTDANGCNLPLGLGSGLGSGNGSGKKPSAPQSVAVDPRHHLVREAIKALQKHLSEQEIWDGSAAKALDRVLRDRPQYTADMLIQCVVHWFATEDQSPTVPPRQWLPSLTTYTGMPLDRFGKPTRKIDTGPYWRIVKGETRPEDAMQAQWEAYYRTALGDPAAIQYARDHSAPSWVIEKLEAALHQVKV